ncbi:hypothetical protein BGZ52_004829, partial [Haplosporangium bisporale]
MTAVLLQKDTFMQASARRSVESTGVALKNRQVDNNDRSQAGEQGLGVQDLDQNENDHELQ